LVGVPEFAGENLLILAVQSGIIKQGLSVALDYSIHSGTYSGYFCL
jgi:hypothetical protein